MTSDAYTVIMHFVLNFKLCPGNISVMYTHPAVNFTYVPEGQIKNDKFIASIVDLRVT